MQKVFAAEENCQEFTASPNGGRAQQNGKYVLQVPVKLPKRASDHQVNV